MNNDEILAEKFAPLFIFWGQLKQNVSKSSSVQEKQLVSELQIRLGLQARSEIFCLISQGKYML